MIILTNKIMSNKYKILIFYINNCYNLGILSYMEYDWL